jgi:hypothetical protein
MQNLSQMSFGDQFSLFLFVFLLYHGYLCWLQQLEDALLQCGDLLDLVALTQGLQDGRLDIYGNYYDSIFLSIYIIIIIIIILIFLA